MTIPLGSFKLRDLKFRPGKTKMEFSLGRVLATCDFGK
jgi:hypothetical protein